MPGQTPTYGLPYQELTDPPNGAAGQQNLAAAVEGELARVDGDQAAQDGRLDALESAPAPAALAAYAVGGSFSVSVVIDAPGDYVALLAFHAECSMDGTFLELELSGDVQGTIGRPATIGGDNGELLSVTAVAPFTTTTPGETITAGLVLNSGDATAPSGYDILVWRAPA